MTQPIDIAPVLPGRKRAAPKHYRAEDVAPLRQALLPVRARHTVWNPTSAANTRPIQNAAFAARRSTILRPRRAAALVGKVIGRTTAVRAGARREQCSAEKVVNRHVGQPHDGSRRLNSAVTLTYSSRNAAPQHDVEGTRFGQVGSLSERLLASCPNRPRAILEAMFRSSLRSCHSCCSRKRIGLASTQIHCPLNRLDCICHLLLEMRFRHYSPRRPANLHSSCRCCSSRTSNRLP